MKEKMTMQEAIQRVLQAEEYYDMVQDTGEEKQKEKNTFASAKKIPAHFLKKEEDKHMATR